MPYVRLKGGNRLWYEEQGEGMPIVFIHGWRGSSWHACMHSEHVVLRAMIDIIDHYNVEDKLGEIEVPTLILAGDEETFTSPEDSRSMHEKIKNSERRILSQGKEMIQFEALEEFNKTVENFLKKIQSATSFLHARA